MAAYSHIDPLQHLSLTASRRLEVRYNLPSISYVHVDEDNGGVVLNICEGGVSLQAVHPLVDNRFLRLKFKLPDSGIWVKVNGQVVWLSQSKTHAGVCFVDLPETVRAEIRDWVSSVTVARKMGEPGPRADAVGRRARHPNRGYSAAGSATPRSRYDFPKLLPRTCCHQIGNSSAGLANYSPKSIRRANRRISRTMPDTKPHNILIA